MNAEENCGKYLANLAKSEETPKSKRRFSLADQM